MGWIRSSMFGQVINHQLMSAMNCDKTRCENKTNE
jgi:hypothetical protein